jgi:hypothetical protein
MEATRKKKAESEKKKRERIESHGCKKEQQRKEEEELVEKMRRQFWQGRRGERIRDIRPAEGGGGRNARTRVDILTRLERSMAKFRIIVARRWSGCKDFAQHQGHDDNASLSGGGNNRRTKTLTMIMWLSVRETNVKWKHGPHMLTMMKTTDCCGGGRRSTTRELMKE